MSTQQVLNIRKQALFDELTSVNDKVKKTISLVDAQVYLRRMNTLESTFRTLHIEILTYNAGVTDKRDLVIVADIDSFIVLIDSINSKCLKAIDDANIANASSAIASTSAAAGSSSSSAPAPAKTGPALQKIQIPIFDGSIDQWENFIALFDSLVNGQKGIDDITKLQYLRLYTAKEAHATVARFILEPASYALAYDALKKRYASNRRIAAFHIQKLLKFDSKSDFLQMLEIHRSATSALINLKLTDLADFILFQISYNNCDSTIKASFDNENTSTLPTLDELLSHVEKRARNQELELDIMSATPVQQKGSNPPQQKQSKSRAHVTQAKPNFLPKCKHCSEPHQLYHCDKFKELTPADRVKFIKSVRACFNCFGSHEVRECKSKSVCRTCSRPHHTLLHLPTATAGTNVPTAAPVAEMPASVLTCVSANQVLLATIHCQVQDSFGNFHDVFALLDNASQRSLVTTRLVNRLSLQRKNESRCILGVSQHSSTSHGAVEITLRSRFDPSVTFSTNASVLNRICDDLPAIPLSQEVYRKFSKLQLADYGFHRHRIIDILLAADAYAYLLSEDTPNLILGEPTAQKTKFGWVLFGATPVAQSQNSTSMTMLTRTHSLESTIRNFWEIEHIPEPSPHLNPEDVIAEEHFAKTHSRDSDGRYILRLPFRNGSNPEKLSNRMAAEKCLKSLERRLDRQPQVKQQYDAFIQEFIELKHMQVALSPSNYVLPHHCVMKESTSTKLRCVFNASAKDVLGTSLNDSLLPGPKLQADVGDILIRFRFHNIALCGDIKMMFRQMSIHPDDRQYQHIFYRFSPSEPIQEFEITRVVYGMTSSSFLAQRTLRQIAADEGHRFPNAAAALVQDFYMDDYVGGSSSISAARQLRQELTQLLDAGCMPLRKWSSSHPEVLSDLPDSHKEIPLEFSTGDPMLKILGLCYLPQEDAFSYRIKPFEGAYSKRTVLSYISRCFDPLGLLCGVICRAKQFIQQLWLLRNDWDDPLPQQLHHDWEQFLVIMNEIPNFRIPRCFNVDRAVLRLVCFSDASTSAYAACVYLHVQKGESAEVHLVKAKSRVAPLKTQSVPRLELLGCLPASQLLRSILDATPNRNYASIHMLTDSTIVLAWLKTPPHTLETFVANRVVSITDLTTNCQWAHVQSEFNAADCASRGFIDDQIWWSGPEFLRRSPEYWNITLPPEAEVPEVSTALVTSVSDSIIERFSKLTMLLHVVARIRRIANHARCKSAILSGPVSVRERNDALLLCIRITQATEFSAEIRCIQSTPDRLPYRISKFTPFLDKVGLLRVGGRLKNSSLSYASKHPLLLPKKCHLASLICDYYHKCLLHAGPRQTLCFITRKFWIISAHSLIRQRIKLCNPCYRLSAAPLQPIMADLPASRVQPAPAFYATASDFAGPFETKETSRPRSPRHKSYCCIFVDMASKAVHIEAVSELSTAGFMAAFHRFCARRSLPAALYTDCGRNYVGAARQLKEVSTFLESHQQELYTQMASLNVNWYFNPPAAPNFGGIFEAAVKSMKLLLYRQIGNTVLTFEELSTLFARIEAVLNSRPLGVISSDPNDGNDILTPGHLLVGRPLVAPPEPCLTDNDVSGGTRWRRVQALAQAFWRRWSSEYLHTQMQRQKWTRDCPNPTVGSVVYVTGLSSSPLSWPLGIIERVHPSKDSKVRVVTVRTASAVYTRPTNRLVFLPIAA